MSKYWTHAAMLLLGISITVGFYEGRRLVRNTSRALSAMSQIGTTAERRDRADDIEAAVADAPRRDRATPRVPVTEPKRTRGGANGAPNRKGAKASDPNRSERLNTIRDLKARQRVQRIDPAKMPRVGRDQGIGLPVTPGPGLEALDDLPPVDELEDELVDTGLEAP